MITFGQTSMKRDGWTTGVPLNTEFVAGCSHGTMPAHMCVPSGHTPEIRAHAHTHTIVFANGQSASHTTLSLFCSVFSRRHVTSSFNCLVLEPLTTAVMCRVCTHPACFENVHELRGRAGRRKKKKSSSNLKSRRGHRNNTQSQSGSHGDKCGSVQ